MCVGYNVRNISLLRVLTVLLITPSTDIAIAAAELHCLLHFISSVIKIPRSLSVFLLLLCSIDTCQISICRQVVTNRHFVVFLYIKL